MLLALSLIITLSTPSATKNARSIMELVDNAPDGETRRSVLTMTLTNKNGKSRKREVLSYSKDFNNETKNVMVFNYPADVKGTAYLSYEYEDADKEDDRWIFLPALRKVRRISGSSKNDNFMGSDFTYDDMGDRDLDEYTYTLLSEEECMDGICWKIQSIPVDRLDSNYSKIVSLIHQDALKTVEAEFYDRDGRLQKKLKANVIKKHQGFWTVFSLSMHNVQNDHKTKIELGEYSYNVPVKDSVFRVSSLERGRIR